MTNLSAEPQVLATVAADVDGIRVRIAAAVAAAASATSGPLAPAADEVSEAFANVLRQFGQEYQAAVAQGGLLYGTFAQKLAAAGSAYAAAEADAQALLGIGPAPAGGGGPTASPLAITATDIAIVMGGSGNPIPSDKFIGGVLKWAGLNYSWAKSLGIFTPENLYPLTGTKSLTLSDSVNEGVQILDQTIKGILNSPTSSVLVQGYSQSAIISSLEMRNLLAAGSPYAGHLNFNLLGDPMNPNGGLLARFPGLNLASIGLNFYGATPANTPWTTNIYSLEYDGFADFPRYPLDIFSDLNAVAGIAFVHPDYPKLDPTSLPPGSIVKLPVSSDYTGALANTTYWMVHTQDLPLLDPVRDIPIVGKPIADLLQPDLQALVNLGYGDPRYGYSTSPANLPTQFGLFPNVSPGVMASALASGTQQGMTAFASDIMAPGTGASLAGIPHSLPSLPSLSSLGATLPALSGASIRASLDGFIHSLQVANNHAADALSGALSSGYSTLLPTADIANAALISIPAYDVNLFLSGIGQAAAGDPIGLVNAIGNPIAADVGLVSVAGGVEGLVLILGAASVLKDLGGI